MIEDELIKMAQQDDDDIAAALAMEMLREIDPTYMWCDDCDGLVVKQKDCCLAKNYEPLENDFEF